MLALTGVNHIAIIASNYQVSRDFYCNVLGFRLINEIYRTKRDSWKGDLALGEQYLIELFSFPDAPTRPSYPEACGLRHLAFTVEDIDTAILTLKRNNVICEPIRIDPTTGRAFTFFNDPDGLPLELYQGN